MVEVSKLNKLSSRERRVLEARVLADKPMTLEELAAEFGVARVRVRQLEARVLEKMGMDIRVRHQSSTVHSIVRAQFPCTRYFAANHINVSRVYGKAA